MSDTQDITWRLRNSRWQGTEWASLMFDAADEVERLRKWELQWFHIIGYTVIAVMLMGLGAQLFMLADTFFNWS